jgi:SecD/SecF fusion protein
MLGIASSMFTALFVTRVIFDWLLARRIISDHLLMLMLIRKPNVNWMAKRPVFIGISSLLILGGLTVFLTRDDAKNNKYDIEFTGGTTAVINLKKDLPIQQVRDRLADIANKLENPALAAANIYSINKSAKQYEINTTETNKSTVDVTFSPADKQTAETITTAIGTKLPDFAVKPDVGDPNRFIVTTRQTSRSLIENTLKEVFPTARLSEPKVDEVVNKAILTAFAEQLQIQQNLQPRLISSEKINDELIDAYPELADFLGGLKILCQTQKPITIQQLRRRINDLRFKPDTQNLNWYSYKILKSDLTGTEPGEQVQSFVYLSIEPEAGFRELSLDEWSRFVENEKSKLLAATKMESSLPRVTQIAPTIGAEAKTRALIAIVLSLFSIVAYIWIRFGNLRYGIAAIVALIHDVCITLGAVTVCTYIAATPIGEKLLIGDFKINLAMIAALLTIIGYSLNDTIVVFDRIRENRRKDRPSPAIITSSINQTLSRTLLTSFTTFIVVLIMYVFGGQALRGFTFAIGFGIIVGTYSSIAIAAPILLLGSGKSKKNK